MQLMGVYISSLFTIIFSVFLIAACGYLLGAISIRGIKLGTAGVLLTALLFGVISSYIPSFEAFGKEVVLFSGDIKEKYSLICNIGTAVFVSSIGLIAGPKFFRSFNKSCLAYVMMGIAMVAAGAVLTALLIRLDENMPADLAVGLMTGALTSTPGLSAAKETAGAGADLVVAGYGIAYLFGVLGVVLFVQIMPKLLKVDMAEERNKFAAANTVCVPQGKGSKKVDSYGFFPFMLTVALGCTIGAIRIPGIDFSLGASGGCLVAGLVIGHFGHMGKIDLSVGKTELNFFRELGLVLFLIGSGVPGGVNFVEHIKLLYFVYGALITLVPMLVGYAIAKWIFKLDLFNNLGSISGGMTCTPALGALISSTGEDEVASAYAATYPVALMSVVFAAKIITMLT